MSVASLHSFAPDATGLMHVDDNGNGHLVGLSTDGKEF